MKTRPIFLSLLLLTLCASLGAQEAPKYKNPRLPVDERVGDLLSRMTLEEKVDQLRAQMTFLKEYPQRDYSVGHFRNIAHFLHEDRVESAPARECAEAINRDSHLALEANRLGIPVLQNGEALHGAQWGSATSFPQSIAMAASFDDAFYFSVGEAVARELRAVGVRQVFAPVVNLSRDPRWGRTEESYGEDPFLCGRFGATYTRALEQGGVIASPKHFVDNYGDGGHDSYASNNSWRTLREIFLEPFRACIEEGGARSVMAAYNSVDGVPCTASSVLLNDILRKEWNFQGFTISDYGGVHGVYSHHRIASTLEEAQAQSLEAGLDVELPTGGNSLLALVRSGRLSEEVIDRSVRRVLRCKFELGLFEDPYVDAGKAEKIVRSPEHRALALEAARKVMTLLKNDKNTLPLDDKTVKRIGVFGPAADELSLGGYSGGRGGWRDEGAVNPYQGLCERLKGKAEVVLHQPGTDVEALARSCDAVIFFAVIREGEFQDRSHLRLPATTMRQAPQSLENAIIVDNKEGLDINVDQEAMIAQLAASGTKTIVVLQNGSVIDIRAWADRVDAILEAWHSGEQGGTAIAETLFGDINPGGRLPFTWARHAGQLPIYYNIKPSGRGYIYNDDDGKPTFPFGYGLSYTSFEYSNLTLPEVVVSGKDVQVHVTVKNTGSVSGDEVVQLYLHDEYASVARPIKELKAFKRVTLAPGESREVTLILPARSFGFWDRTLKFTTEPGDFRIYISRNAEETLLEGRLRLE